MKAKHYYVYDRYKAVFQYVVMNLQCEICYTAAI